MQLRAHHRPSPRDPTSYPAPRRLNSRGVRRPRSSSIRTTRRPSFLYSVGNATFMPMTWGPGRSGCRLEFGAHPPPALTLVAAWPSKSGDRRASGAGRISRRRSRVGNASGHDRIVRLLTFGSSGMLAKQIENSAPFYLSPPRARVYASEAAVIGPCDKVVLPYARAGSWWDGPKASTRRPSSSTSRAAVLEGGDREPGARAVLKAAQEALGESRDLGQAQGPPRPGDNVQSTLRYARPRRRLAIVRCRARS